MEITRIIVSDIEWDTDGELVEGLPEEYFYILHEPFLIDDEYTMDDLNDEVLDDLSDTYGWCVQSCNIKTE